MTGSIALLAQTTYIAVKMLDKGFGLYRERATVHVGAAPQEPVAGPGLPAWATAN